ncbi:Galactinol synthase 6 [Lachnellula arida]|uniref:Galactinol synthase 6 n=1 Tax=Lachnellula arida TaxID=1316785 RepID=A0A8T9B568_9HELO|nr:Galactinol synthase 6 [Lachnellula arida]
MLRYKVILPKLAWVTLVTKASYLPGAVLLAYSLQKHKSRYPLIILTTPSFPASLIPQLQEECSLSNGIHLPIDPLSPPPHNLPPSLIAARFADTWTKLRVFELYKYGGERLVFLDADMLVRRNMDELFDLSLSLPRDCIAANHACVCNLDKDAWAPASWTRENCAYTGLLPGDAPTRVPARGEEGKETHMLLNGGLFLFTPFAEQWDAMLRFLAEDERVRTYMFPDQDFLADFFRDRWRSVGWQYNALKTMRYWHTGFWDDGEVRNLHYIVDKPWSKRVGSDGIAGYLGRDGVTHCWWWEEFDRWEREREEMGKGEILKMMRNEVAKPLELADVADRAAL